jgi:UDP-GlcNAc:undecaprenyl-phosphate/decaprenyl-phosphate GlcNAc-1-phosphate transferase
LSDTYAFLIVFILAFSTTLALTPLTIWLGSRLNIVATPGGRRRHQGRVSKLGGIAIFAGFAVAALAAQYLPIARFDPYEIIRFTGLMLGACIIFTVGILDDIYELNAIQLGIAQIAAAAVAVGFQIFIQMINNPITGQQTDPFPPLVAVTLSMLWLGIMMNTVNFMDGIDGLAAGMAFITGTMLFIHSAFILHQTSVSLLPLALMGSSFGFLLLNFYPAKVFMGGGAYVLGYLLGTLSIIGGAKMATILLVMGLPLLDFAWQVFNRMRQGRNPMHGDRGHLHFRLQDIGIDQRQIALLYYVFCAFFGVLTLVTSSRLFKFVAFGTMVMLVVAGFALISVRVQGRRRAELLSNDLPSELVNEP